MIKIKSIFTAVLSLITICMYSRTYTNGSVPVEEYRLSNGLTVCLMPNSGDADVCGAVVVRAGTVDEPDSHRGTATFLRFALMSGTQKIGAFDWEKEKPVYDEIVALYDSLSTENDTALYSDLWQRISKKTAEAAEYSSSDEFADLLGMMGATDIYSEVFPDYSLFRSNFPPSEVERWLSLNSERFINPVFRNFQQQLNLSYEYYNKHVRDWKSNKVAFLNSQLYKGTPYGRPQMGSLTDLKHPSLSAMNEFFDTWYVANNMVLVLVGNFDSEVIKPLIEKTFGRLSTRRLPERKVYPTPDFSERKKIKTDQFRGTAGFGWYFQGPEPDSDEFLCLDIARYILSNHYRSGLINQLENNGLYESSNTSELNSVGYIFHRGISGSVIDVSVSPPVLDNKSILPQGKKSIVPLYSNTKSIVFDKIAMLKDTATIPNLLFQNAKHYQLDKVGRFFDGSNIDKSEALCSRYAMNLSVGSFYDIEAIQRMSKTDIATFAKKYFTNDFLSVIFDVLPTPKRTFTDYGVFVIDDIIPFELPATIDKQAVYLPDFKESSMSQYAKQLMLDGIRFPEIEKTVSSEVVEKIISGSATMYYTSNTSNPAGNNFTLTLRYEYGKQDDKDMGELSNMLARTGIMLGLDETARRRLYGDLGVTVSIDVDYNYFYIDLMGNERDLERVLNMTKIWLQSPYLDENQEKYLWNMMWSERAHVLQTSNFIVNNALRQYVCHGKLSDFLNVSPKEDLFFYSVRSSDGSFAVFYDFLTDKKPFDKVMKMIITSPLDMFYRGNMPADSVASILVSAAPMAESDRIPVPRREKPLVSYRRPYVHVNTSLDYPFSSIAFYARLTSFKDDEYIPARVFSIYFQNLLDEELKRKHALIMNPDGGVKTPSQLNGGCCFMGEIEVDGPATNRAIDLYMKLFTDLPLDEQKFRMAVRTCYSELVNSLYGRDKGKVYNHLKNIYPAGLPVAEWFDELKAMTIYDMSRFYELRIKRLPMQIIITGKSENIDFKELEAKYGKVRRVGTSTLFRDSKEIKYKRLNYSWLSM